MSELEELGFLAGCPWKDDSCMEKSFFLNQVCSSHLQLQSKGHFLSIILKYLWSGFRIRANSSRESEGGKARGTWQGDDTRVAAHEACMFLFLVLHFSQFQVLQHSANTLTLCITE